MGQIKQTMEAFRSQENDVVIASTHSHKLKSILEELGQSDEMTAHIKQMMKRHFVKGKKAPNGSIIRLNIRMNPNEDFGIDTLRKDYVIESADFVYDPKWCEANVGEPTVAPAMVDGSRPARRHSRAHEVRDIIAKETKSVTRDYKKLDQRNASRARRATVTDQLPPPGATLEDYLRRATRFDNADAEKALDGSELHNLFLKLVRPNEQNDEKTDEVAAAADDTGVSGDAIDAAIAAYCAHSGETKPSPTLEALVRSFAMKVRRHARENDMELVTSTQVTKRLQGTGRRRLLQNRRRLTRNRLHAAELRKCA